MLVMMTISLYTSRVTLVVLGVEDYGIYNVVGGIVVIMSFLNTAMAGATQRFLNFEMGKGLKGGMHRVFSSALVIHFIVAGVMLLIAETGGLWFLNTYMNIASERIEAANYVYQFSVAAFLINILYVPYNATIIAHEKMSAFAYISIIEAVLKLLIVFLIQTLLFDKLILYGILIFCVGLITQAVYRIYCRKHFEETHFKRTSIDRSLVKKMLSFSSWTIFGNLGFILHTQGIAILINIFFGATVNAAQGVSNQVNAAVSQFVSNFQMALNPQIVKNYAANNLNDMHKLMFRGCRYSFFLITFFAIPLIIEAPSILNIWLKEVPEYSVWFVRTVLIVTLFNSYSSIMSTAQSATGNIKRYQVLLTTIGAFHLPLALLAFWMGLAPYWCNIVYIVIITILQLVRVLFVSRSTQMSLIGFCKSVLFPSLIVLSVSSIIPFILHFTYKGNYLILAAKCFISFIITGICVFSLGMEAVERKMIIEQIRKRIKK